MQQHPILPLHSGHLNPSVLEQIALKRQRIQRIKVNHQQKLQESNKQFEETLPPHQHPHTSTSTVIDYADTPPLPPPTQLADKNPGVTDTDKMLFDKKFKNYLNHKQQYLQRARKRLHSHHTKPNRDTKLADDQGDDEYYNEQEILSNTGSDYQYRDASDMQAAYEQMTTGKKRKATQMQLFPCELNQNQFRRFQFLNLLVQSEQEERKLQSISKDRFLNYLFDQPAVMMLYSINPYQVGDELAQLETLQHDLLNFQEFSQFLLTDREPTYFDYTQENLNEARKLGRGIKCTPIIAKWIDDSGIFQFLVQTFKQLDIRGDSKVDRTFLAKKLHKQASARRITQTSVIQIVNINKCLPLNRLLYELQYEQPRENKHWSEQQFLSFLQNYKRKSTPDKDKLITKLILTGKYDSSYVYVVSQEVLDIVKEVFKQMPKYAQYFVLKEKFLQKLCSDPRYKKIQNMWVRSQSNRYVKQQTLQETLVRLLAEGETYLDIEEILDFLTNRGRPKSVEYRVYLENLHRQLTIIEEEERRKLQQVSQNQETGSSDQEFSQLIRQKQLKRKQNKLKQIRISNNFQQDKRFHVTIPLPFMFDSRDKQKKTSIRQQKLKAMLEEKQRKIKEEMKPLPIKEVPENVKEHLYQRMLKEQQRQRKERLEKFRLEIMSQINVSERLIRPKSKEIHCDFTTTQYKFSAKPMPWYCEVNLLNRIGKKKQQRRLHILEQIITRNSNYELPQGVQRMINRQEEREQKKATKVKTASTGSLNQCTFNPKISHGIPDFKTIHEHLHFDIQNAKNIKEPIKVTPFSFENRPQKSRTTYQAQKPKVQGIRHSKCQKIDHEQQFQNIPKTQKFQALVQLRRKQLQEKQKEQQKQKRLQAVRKLRESKFAPVVWQALKRNADDPQKSRAIMSDRIKEFKRQEKRRKEQYENQMIRILTKVYERPLLLQSGDGQQKNAKRGAADSNISRSKVKKEQFQNEENFLDAGYYGKKQREDFKLNLDKPKQKIHLDDQRRRAAVQGHHLGQYPHEDYEPGYQEHEEQGSFHESDMEGEEYEAMNLHTS